MNPDATDRRIRLALETYLGSDVPSELLLGGASQGVQVAVELARRFPERYRWLVLLSPSKELPVRGLQSLRGAYFLVGEHENQWPAKAMVQKWGYAGIPVTLTVIEDGGHADFHGRGNELMREAFRQLGLSAPPPDGSSSTP
jgi:pimeloyl-ACP methyl ester carboxylesterase